MREAQVRFLGKEDPLKKEMTTHSSTLGWKIPLMEEPGRLQSVGSQRVRHNWATSLSLWSQEVWILQLFFFFQDYLTVTSIFHFHIHCKIILSFSAMASLNFVRNEIESVIHFREHCHLNNIVFWSMKLISLSIYLSLLQFLSTMFYKF